MKGIFICMGPHVKRGYEVTSSEVESDNTEGPTNLDVLNSLRPIQDSDMVVFIGEDGSAWLVKNQYARFRGTFRLEAPPEGESVAKTG